jgi:hypothetical protein
MRYPVLLVQNIDAKRFNRLQIKHPYGECYKGIGINNEGFFMEARKGKYNGILMAAIFSGLLLASSIIIN